MEHVGRPVKRQTAETAPLPTVFASLTTMVFVPSPDWMAPTEAGTVHMISVAPPTAMGVEISNGVPAGFSITKLTVEPGQASAGFLIDIPVEARASATDRVMGTAGLSQATPPGLAE